MELQSLPNLEILWKGNSKIVVSYSCGCDLVLRPRSLFFTVPLLLLLLVFSDFSTSFSSSATFFFANKNLVFCSFLFFFPNLVAFSPADLAPSLLLLCSQIMKHINPDSETSLLEMGRESQYFSPDSKFEGAPGST